MTNRHLAKTENRKTILEHTDDLVYHYEKFKNRYPSLLTDKEWELLRYSIICHDVGKVNRRFQNKLYAKLGLQRIQIGNEEINEIPHGYLSPAFINYEYMNEKGFSKDEIKVLVSSVVYHHARSELDGQMELNIESLMVELAEDMEGFAFAEYPNLLIYPSMDFIDKINFRELINRRISDPDMKKYVLIKGLLNKIDYFASAFSKDGMMEIPAEDVYGHVGKYVERYFNSEKLALRPIQEFVIKNTDKNLIITASTGIGKTEAGLFWSDGEKTFFTLPLRVSINAIYKRIKTKYGYEKVELLHSTMIDVLLDEKHEKDEFILDRMKNAKLHSSPLIITTVDQLFKFVFLYNGFEPILATLSYSKVIIDEIQMYDTKILAALIRGIRLIQDYGGKFMIMTATMPRYVRELMLEHGINFDLDRLIESSFMVSDEKTAKRHFLELRNDFLPIEEIIERSESFKILIIANTVKRAQYIYTQLADKTSAKVLHSRFIQKHRSLLEKDIQDFSGDRGQNGIWISTQIVEASLDIDFDILYTEMCSIDSLIQRMGRVMRHRFEWNHSYPNINVFDTRNTGQGKVIDWDIYNASVKTLSSYSRKWILESDKQKMMDCVFDENMNPDIVKYKNDVKQRLLDFERLHIHKTSKRQIENDFRGINSANCIPFEIYSTLESNGELEKIKSRMQSAPNYQERLIAKNELMKYTMNIPFYLNEIAQAPDELLRKMNIFITYYKYDFSEEKLTGGGLLDESVYEDGFL